MTYYTKNDLYDGMLLKWASTYRWNKSNKTITTVIDGFDGGLEGDTYADYDEDKILNHLNNGQCKVVQSLYVPLIFNI